MVRRPARDLFEQGTLSRLQGLGRRLRWYLLLDGLAVVGAAVVAAALVTLAVDRTLRLERDMRATQLVSLVAALGLLTWWFVLRPLRVPIRIEHLALLIERQHPQLESRLVSAVEFAGGEAAAGAASKHHSTAMTDAVVRQAHQQATTLRFNDALNHRRARRCGLVLVACLGVLAGLTLVAPGMMGLWCRRNVLLRNVEWPQRNRLTVEGLTDGKIMVARGDDVTIAAAVDPGFEPPRQVYVRYRYRGSRGSAGREQMPAVRGEVVRFTHTFERIDGTVDCQITGGDAVTDEFTVEVADRPRIEAAHLRIEPPAYTKMNGFDLRSGQTVAECLKGSKVSFRITTNKPVARTTLIRQVGRQENSITQVKRISDHEFEAIDRPEATGSYYFVLVDALGLNSVSERTPPVRFSIRLVADQPPKVTMKIKGVGEMITPEAILPIETDFSDTYGLASAELVHSSSRTTTQPAPQPIPGFEPGTKTFGHPIDWVVRAHGLAEGDRLTLYAQARDFDDVSGPNLGKSPASTFRVVSRDELLAELNRREQEYRQDFERILRQQEELYSDLLGLSQAAEANKPAQERAGRLNRLARQHRDQTGRISALRMQVEQVLSELRVNQLSNPAVESRLGTGVVEPMNALGRVTMPAAGEKLENLARSDSAEGMQQARGAQETVLADMRKILANMLKWEGFQEAVTLLRDVLKMQQKVAQDTEARIESEVLGTAPASGPSSK